MARLLQCLLFFAKARISPGEIARQLSRIDNDNGVRRWLYRCGGAREGGPSFVVLAGKFLA